MGPVLFKFIEFVDFVVHLCYSGGMTTPLTLHDGQCVTALRGRAAAIVRWVAARADRLNGRQRVKLEFDCAGSKVKPRCAVFEDEVPITVG